MAWSSSPASPRTVCPGRRTSRTTEFRAIFRAMAAKLDHEDLGIALEYALTMNFMQQGGELGARVVHTGRLFVCIPL